MNTTAQKLFMAVLVLIGVVAGAVLALRIANNPTEERHEVLRAEIESIQVKPVFYVTTSEMSYDEIMAAFTARPRLWTDLIEAPKEPKPGPTGPNFAQLLQGVKPSRVQMTVDGQVKLRVATPEHPRGTWMQVGDTINTTTVTAITDKHLVVEKPKGGKVYTHKLLRN